MGLGAAKWSLGTDYNSLQSPTEMNWLVQYSTTARMVMVYSVDAKNQGWNVR